MVEVFRLLFDLGLMILVQLVQWIIYPSLARLSKSELYAWHAIYAKRITFWVLPLFLGQYLCIGLQLYEEFDWLNLISLILVMDASYVTFFKAVPLHAEIDRQMADEQTFPKLLKWNFRRTISWTLAFVMGFFHFLIEN